MDGRYHGMDYRKKPRHAAGSQSLESGNDWQARAAVKREWEVRAAAKQGGREGARPRASQPPYTGGGETLRPYTPPPQYAGEGEALRPYTPPPQYTGEGETLRPYTPPPQYAGEGETLRPYTPPPQYAGEGEALRPYTPPTQYAGEGETLRPYTPPPQYAGEGETLRPYTPPPLQSQQHAAESPAPEGRARRKKRDKRGLLEKRLSLVVLFLLTFSFGLATLLMVILPRSTVSKIEKRELATLPRFSLESYFSGEFTAGVANFYDDTVPMRDSLKNLGNNFKAVWAGAWRAHSQRPIDLHRRRPKGTSRKTA